MPRTGLEAGAEVFEGTLEVGTDAHDPGAEYGCCAGNDVHDPGADCGSGVLADRLNGFQLLRLVGPGLAERLKGDHFDQLRPLEGVVCGDGEAQACFMMQ
jgi:hypothetical protein